jgi:predicted DNA-binding transcriptional regulator AlpA
VETPPSKLYRFADLKAAQVVTSWPQLRRMVDNDRFPPGYLLSPGRRVWDAPEVEAWLQTRRDAANHRQAEAA